MFDELNKDDIEFLHYLINQLPASFLFMTYQDFLILKKLKPKIKGKITESDINRLELKMTLGGFKDFMKGQKNGQ